MEGSTFLLWDKGFRNKDILWEISELVRTYVSFKVAMPQLSRSNFLAKRYEHFID
jgi:hypothetical protein